MSGWALTFLEFIESFISYAGCWQNAMLFVLAYIYLMIMNEIFRNKIGYGILLLMVFLGFPPLYTKLWTRVFHSTFWRVYWMFCIEFIYGLTLVDLIKRIKRKWLCTFVVIISIVILLISGNFMYSDETFVKAENAYKLKEKNVEIAKYLLSIDPHPTVLASMDVAVQVRMYSDDIRLLYGRDILGYSVEKESINYNIHQVAKLIKKKRLDIDYITDVCRNYGIRYMIIGKKKNMEEISQKGWRLIAVIEDKYIYLYD